MDLTTEIEIASRYAAAVTARREAEAAQSRLVRDNIEAYDRYFDLAVKTTPEFARESLPAEAETVDRIENGILAVTEARERFWQALSSCMVAFMEHEGAERRAENASGAEALLASLEEARRFRIENLDGIDGRFAEQALQGVGFRVKEKTRLLNRMVSAWTKAAGVNAREMEAAMAAHIGTVLEDGPALAPKP